ncbi:MAG: hypothetical protein AAFV53_03125 [Myxococcota bacterium]
MSLLHDAIDMITSGHALQAAAQMDGNPTLTLTPHVDGGYLLTGDAENTPPRRFTQPVSAVRTFYRLVGTNGLAGAIASYRYRALFPCGSSLEWPPIPLAAIAAK